MTKELVTIEFRYHDKPKGEHDSGHPSKTITIGVFDTFEEAIIEGNKALEVFEKEYLMTYSNGIEMTVSGVSANGEDDNEDSIIMQCTSLKDKHGKDIYEGDILEYKCGGKTWIREVIFQFGAFGTRVEDDNISHFFNVLTESETEIIGNIYENPNKLKF